MADQTPIDIRRLGSLLDDPDEAVAISAMAELLNREPELGDLPAELQESASPLMRRRVHQLQSALTMIRRRRYLFSLLQSDDINFCEALIQIHLQWFDNDSQSALNRKIRNFCQELQHHPCDSLEEIGNAFAACAVTAAPVTTLKVEQFCIGVMLEEKSEKQSRFTLTYEEGVQPQKALFGILAKEEWNLLEMKKPNDSLENIFMGLIEKTEGEEIK
ncbi:MAG: hypothetical protein IKZ25_00435 [Clostridia bacterium]|nr:hypothetical protein [Clostridia bacterium]